MRKVLLPIIVALTMFSGPLICHAQSFGGSNMNSGMSGGFGTTSGFGGTGSSGMGGMGGMGSGMSGGMGGMGTSGFGGMQGGMNSGLGGMGQGTSMGGMGQNQGQQGGFLGRNTNQQGGLLGRPAQGQQGQNGQNNNGNQNGGNRRTAGNRNNNMQQNGNQQFMQNNGGMSTARQQPLVRPRQKVGFEYSKPQMETVSVSLKTRFTEKSTFKNVTFTVENSGELVLKGQVASVSDAKLMENLVRMEPGVKKIRNELTYPSPSSAENTATP